MNKTSHTRTAPEAEAPLSRLDLVPRTSTSAPFESLADPLNRPEQHSVERRVSAARCCAHVVDDPLTGTMTRALLAQTAVQDPSPLVAAHAVLGLLRTQNNPWCDEALTLLLDQRGTRAAVIAQLGGLRRGLDSSEQALLARTDEFLAFERSQRQ